MPQRSRNTLKANRGPTAISRVIVACIFLNVATSGCSRFATVRNGDVVHSRQLALQGSEALSRGQFLLAEERFAKAVEIHPDDDGTRQLYAEALWNRGAGDQAVEQMREAVRLSGRAPTLLVRLGQMYLSQGDLDDAKKCADEATKANRSLATAHSLRGDILRRRGRLAGALPHYHRSLQLATDIEVELSVAEIYFERRLPQRCLATLQALASRLPPDKLPSRVHFLEGLALKSLGRFDEAVERLQVVANGETPNVNALYHLADAQRQQGDHGNARLSIERVLRLEPEHVPARQLLASLYKPDNPMGRTADARRSR